VSTTPTGGRKFLGEFSPETVTLSLASLPEHRRLEIACDLFILKSWDGSSSANGPDIWELVADGTTLIHTTFALATPTQAYPGTYPDASNPARTGAVEPANSLGISSNSVYHLKVALDHTAPTLQVTFKGLALQVVADESWGLDNVTVTAR
jgi:hypothetical protein